MKFSLWKLFPLFLFCYLLFGIYAFSKSSEKIYEAKTEEQSEKAYLNFTISNLKKSVSNLEIEKEELENNLQECSEEKTNTSNIQNYSSSYSYDYEKDYLERKNRNLGSENERLKNEIEDLEDKIDDLESR